MRLPLSFDVTPRGKMVDPAFVGDNGYIENENFVLHTRFTPDSVIISYYGDDGGMASEKQLFQILKESGLKNWGFVSTEGMRIELPILIEEQTGRLCLVSEYSGNSMEFFYVPMCGDIVEVDDAMVIWKLNPVGLNISAN
jgi:hypothetical protein